MELFAIGICALCAVLFAALVQKTNKEYALLISLGTAAVLLLFLLERAGPVLQQVEDLAASGPLEGEAVGLMLRAVGITVVVVTHEHELARRFSKRVIRIDHGSVVGDTAEAPVGEVLL